MRKFPVLVCLALAAMPLAAEEAKTIRIGMIGLDTSHAPAFTKILHDPAKAYPVRVVAAVPQVSEDIESSVSRIDGFVETLTKDHGVKMMDSIEAMLAEVDAVMIESVDGRKHLAQVEPALRAGKPVFIDKPLAASMEDAVAIMKLSQETGTPVWSCSNLRYHPGVAKAAAADVGEVAAVVSYGPASLEPNHMDLAWYGIHAVESLFTVMGPGCESVSRVHTDGIDVVTGVWKDGRVGTVLGLRAAKAVYGVKVFGSKGMVEETLGAGYPELMEAIVKFFQTKVVPVSPEETLEIFAFMAAADESKAKNGAAVKLGVE